MSKSYVAWENLMFVMALLACRQLTIVTLQLYHSAMYGGAVIRVV